MTGLGLGFTNSGGTWGKWDMCLCFGCGAVGGVRGESAAWARVLEGGGMYVCCESGFSVLMAGPGICILCYADSCAS